MQGTNTFEFYFYSIPPFLLLLRRREALIDLESALRSLPHQPQAHRTRHRSPADDGLEHQRLAHRKMRISPSPLFQRIADDDEHGPEQLPARPANRRASLRTDWERDLDQPLQRHGDQGERRRAQDREDDVRRRKAAGAGRPDEGEVAQRDDRDGDLDERQVGLCAVHDGRRDGGGDQSDEDEHRARDAAFRLREAVGRQDLREEGGERVEEADVDAKGDEEEVEVRVGAQQSDGIAQAGRRARGGRGNGRGRFGGDEEGGYGGDGGDDGDVEDHVWYVGCFAC